MRYLAATLLTLIVFVVGIPQPSVAAGVGVGQDVPLDSQLFSAIAQSSLVLRNQGAGELQQRRLAGEKAPAVLQPIAIMCDFSDSLLFGRYGQVPGDFPPPMQSEFYYTAHDSMYFHHLLLDVADYYSDVSDGRFTFDFQIHPEATNLEHPMAFYGNDPVEGEQPILLAAHAIEALDADIDFSLYDTVILIHAGAGAETDILGNSPEQIYSRPLDAKDFQQAYEDGIIDTPYIPSNDFPEGEGITQVLILPETEYQDPVGNFNGYFGSLGVYCFEVGLRLGMLSLSDFTPTGRPDSQGIGQYGLMGYGLFLAIGWLPTQPCAFNKQLMGWLDPIDANPDDNATYELRACGGGGNPNTALRVDITGQEYWLVAYRNQDPDGNRVFSFPGDDNGNNTPDFWDADSPTGDGRPLFGVSLFDPATDIKERLTGSEWDFYMSENGAPDPVTGDPEPETQKGAGSGVYIWHIDEGVIQNVFNSSANLFNADPLRKSVDVEEADSIQDLDSRESSDFMLGGFADSFRGEGADEFGPTSLPPTDTAGGAYTGVRFTDFSPVVLDSTFYTWINDAVNPPDTLQGLEYADSLTFRILRDPNPETVPSVRARRALPAGVDVRGSHLLSVDLDGTNGLEEIVLAGQAGEVFALDGDLNEYFDPDTNPLTVVPLAVGTRLGTPVPWNLPPAAGDIDADGEVEIVLTGPNGLYAFNNDGSAVREAEIGSNGLYADLSACTHPPLLYAISGQTYDENPVADVRACVAVYENGRSLLQVFGGAFGDAWASVDLGVGYVTAPLVGNSDVLWATVADTLGGTHRLLRLDTATLNEPSPTIDEISLPFLPGTFTPFVGQDDAYIIVTGSAGQAVTVVPQGTAFETHVWTDQVTVNSPLGAGNAFMGAERFVRCTLSGEPVSGWPRLPNRPIALVEPQYAACPLVLDDDGLIYLHTTQDGRIFAHLETGDGIPGWPLGGPAQAAGSAVAGRFQVGNRLDLVALGSAASITGLSETSGELISELRATLFVWPDVADGDGGTWRMWGGTPWRNGAHSYTHVPGASGSVRGLVADSHICYPSPMTEDSLFVRALTGDSGRARAYIYNLEGERVVESAWTRILGSEPFAIEINMDWVVSGLYICRLVVETDTGVQDQSIVQFAVVH